MKGRVHLLKVTADLAPVQQRQRISAQEVFLLLRYMASPLVTAAADYLVFFSATRYWRAFQQAFSWRALLQYW